MERGILPFDGGYLEQPNKALEIIDLLQGLKAKSIEKAQAQAAAKQRLKTGQHGR